MKLSIPYSEAIQIVKDKYGKEISLSTVNDKTVKVGYALQVKIPFVSKIVSKEICLDVTYEKLDGEDLHLSYNGGFGVDQIIEGVKFLVPQLNDSNLYELGDNKKVIVHLGQVDKVHEALQKVSINDISFMGDNAEINFSLK